LHLSLPPPFCCLLLLSLLAQQFLLLTQCSCRLLLLAICPALDARHQSHK
jgi:hypothetical protein